MTSIGSTTNLNLGVIEVAARVHIRGAHGQSEEEQQAQLIDRNLALDGERTSDRRSGVPQPGMTDRLRLQPSSLDVLLGTPGPLERFSADRDGTL